MIRITCASNPCAFQILKSELCWVFVWLNLETWQEKLWPAPIFALSMWVTPNFHHVIGQKEEEASPAIWGSQGVPKPWCQEIQQHVADPTNVCEWDLETLWHWSMQTSENEWQQAGEAEPTVNCSCGQSGSQVLWPWRTPTSVKQKMAPVVRCKHTVETATTHLSHSQCQFATGFRRAAQLDEFSWSLVHSVMEWSVLFSFKGAN